MRRIIPCSRVSVVAIFTCLLYLSAAAAEHEGAALPAQPGGPQEGAALLAAIRRPRASQFPTPESAVRFVLEQVRRQDAGEAMRVFPVAELARRVSVAEWVPYTLSFDPRSDPALKGSFHNVVVALHLYLAEFESLSQRIRNVHSIGPRTFTEEGSDLARAVRSLEAELNGSELRELKLTRISINDTADANSPIYHAMGVTDVQGVDADVECSGRTAKLALVTGKLDGNWRILSANGINAMTQPSGPGQPADGGAPARRGPRVIKAPDPNNLKLAFVTNNASAFWKLAVAGVHAYEREAHVQITVKLPPTGRTSEQNDILRELVDQGYNGIALSSIAPDEQVEVINAAAKRTNVICFDCDCPGSERLLWLGTDQFAAGAACGEQIVKLLPHGGKVGLFVGSFATEMAARRMRGIEQAIEGHNIEIIARKEDATDRARARSNAEHIMAAFGDINLLCGLWSYNGPAIAAAVTAAGRQGKIKVVAFDEEQGTLDGIRQGVIDCAIVQRPFQFGYLSSKWLHQLAVTGETATLPEGGLIDTGVRVIDASNVNDFSKELAELMSRE